MSSSQLELIRLNHELSEKYELAIGDELDKKPNGQKAKIWQQHRLKSMLDGMVRTNKDLLKQYADEDCVLKDELAAMKGSDLTNFYEALNSVQEYYQTFSNISDLPNNNISVNVDVNFSGEEIFGKYLDLNALHLVFSNIIRHSGIEQDYVQYLERFNSFFYLPDTVRQSKPFQEYLTSLWEYLVDFFCRTNPLIDWKTIDKSISDAFQAALDRGEISISTRGAGKTGNDSGSGSSSDSKSGKKEPLRLGMFNTQQELEALGMDRLKEALEALELKCGGTLQDRAARLWAVRGKKPKDFPANLRAKKDNNSSKKRKLGQDAITSGEEPWKLSLEWKEFRVQQICEIMSAVVSATQKHAEKQQTRTVEEKEAEVREEEFGLLPNADGKREDDDDDGDDDDDDDAPVYNPLNLPLGWDGKPIPYWMYKLHGLGVEYKCEICGNQSYWGRRAFDRHFQEWKHAHGMRCLGIPNTKHFHDITLIEDALALHAKIQNSIQGDQFKGEAEEEFEDTEGNILNRRTYEDLARQGLL